MSLPEALSFTEPITEPEVLEGIQALPIGAYQRRFGNLE